MAQNRPPTIGFVSTYLPKECGIATFTDNLMNAIRSVDKAIRFQIVAISDKKYKYSDVVKFSINQNNNQDYIKAAKFINNSDIDVVVLQHEFNIFGGFNGNKILYLLKHLKKPVAMIMHTVPIFQTKPFKIIPKRYKTRTALLKKIFTYVDKISVMNNIAKDYLEKKLNFTGEIAVIPHGAPPLTANEIRLYKKKKYILEGINKHDLIISTFGLIRPRKGLEYVIKAMPKIIINNPHVKYLILGRYHTKYPKEYFDNLILLVKKLKLEKNIFFISRFLSEQEIYEYLVNTDVYITPYYAKEQVSSGSLSYAIAAGCCVVSTPYIYALDLINNHHVGEFIKFKSSRSIIKVVNNLINQPEKITRYQQASLDLAKSIYWPRTANNYLIFLSKLINKK